MIQISFQSNKDIECLYTLFVKDLEAAVTLNVDNPKALEQCRLQLMSALAIVENLQARPYTNRLAIQKSKEAV